jgi:hypothetical protein
MILLQICDISGHYINKSITEKPEDCFGTFFSIFSYGIVECKRCDIGFNDAKTGVKESFQKMKALQAHRYLCLFSR